MRLLRRPKTVYPALVVLAVALFALSAVGNTNDSHKASHGASYWIGAVGWVGFLLTILALVAYTAFVALSAARGRRASRVHGA
jgi:hypothetical protein